MEKCYVCGREGRFKHLGRPICRKCFLRNIEMRVKRHLGRRLFKRNDKVLVVGEVEKVLLEKAVKEMPLRITFKKKLPNEAKGYNWIVIGKTMDNINEEFLEGLMKGKSVLGKMKRGFFNILEVLTDEEAKKYAELKRIKFKVREKKRCLDKWEEFKEIEYNLYKNIKGLREIKRH